MKTQKVAYNINFEHEIPVIGFGAMGISEFYGVTDKKAAQDAIVTALNYGVNHFDTADGYAFGDNEIFLGKVLNLDDVGNRKKLIIASKAGIKRDRNDPTVRGICIEPEYLKKQLNRSLKNLCTSYLDIFYIHRLPPEASDSELETLALFLRDIKEKGLSRSIGLSEPSLEQLKKIHKISPVSFVQSEYNLLERGIEKTGVLEFCRSNNINFVAYSPLCRGLLTQQLDVSRLESGDFRSSLPKFMGDNYEANIKIINKLKIFAQSRNVSLSCLALAWLREQNVLVIPGMRKPERVLDALSSLQCDLTSSDLNILDEIAFVGATAGTRYSESAMKTYGFKY